MREVVAMIDFKLYLITDRRQTRGRNLSDVVEQALKGGVQAVQLREKDLPNNELYRLAEQIRFITSQYGAKLLINGRADICRDVRADGVHLPQDGISVKAARKIIGPEGLIGVSCHDMDSAVLAMRSCADFITLGPIYFTPSKAPYGDPINLERFAKTVSTLNVPVFGVGGINKSNLLEVMAVGAAGIALISAALSAEHPQAAANDMLEILSRQPKLS
jgi:thiamine-phosphate pyrophosphorylase